MATVKEISGKLPGIARLARVSPDGPTSAAPFETDPIEDAIRTSRRLAGARMQAAALDTAEQSAQAERDEAELRRLNTQLSIAETKQRMQDRNQPAAGAPPQENQVLNTILTIMAEDKRQLIANNDALQLRLAEAANREAQALQQRLAELSAKAEQGGAAALLGQVSQLKEIRGVWQELMPTPTLPTTNLRSVDEAIAVHRVQEDHELRMAELAHRRVMDERRLDIETRKLDAEANSRDAFARTFERVAPTLIGAFGQKIGIVDGAATGAAGEGGPGGETPPTLTNECPQCHQPFHYLASQEVVQCPTCKALLQLHPQGPNGEQVQQGPGNPAAPPPGGANVAPPNAEPGLSYQPPADGSYGAGMPPPVPGPTGPRLPEGDTPFNAHGTQTIY